ncbi:hypothetical protein ABPG74_013879 [Tetrahymena malaccensis]
MRAYQTIQVNNNLNEFNNQIYPTQNNIIQIEDDAQNSFTQSKQDVLQISSSFRSDNSDVIQIIQKKKKKKKKEVTYSYMNIPNPKLIKSSELFYMHGDILIDFQKKNSDFFEDRYSLWNYCKIWPISIVYKNSKTLMLKLEQQILPSSSDKTIGLQIQRYKSYPDQSIHSLMENIERVSNQNQWIGDYLTQYFTQLVTQPMMQRQYFYLRDLFDQYMQGIYTQLTQEGAIYFAVHSGPDFATFDYIFHRAIFSESLGFLLGKSLEELQYIYSKNGYYEIFDFESELFLGKTFLDEWLDTIQRFRTGTPPKKQERKKLDKQLRLITFDDICFYADVSIETFKMSDFYVDRNNPLDFYARVMILDVSLSSIKQILTLREQQSQTPQLYTFPELNQQFPHENIQYTLQAEIFKEKFIDQNCPDDMDKMSDSSLQNDKTCNYRQI